MPKPKKAAAQPAPRNDRDRLLLGIVFLAYVAITFYVAWHHEPWRDEADVWLIDRDGGVGVMLQRMAYVGSPPLWYLLVAVLTKLHLPYFSLTVLHLVIAWGAMLLFLLAAPFSKWVKIFFAFSYFPAYEYSVIARQYALTVLLLFAAMACWKRRKEQPFLFALFVSLLALVTVHGLIMAMFLGAIFLAEAYLEKRINRDVIVSCALMIITGGVSAWGLKPPSDLPATHVWRGMQPIAVPYTLGNAFIQGFPLLIEATVGAIVLVLIARELGKRWQPQVFLWGTIVALIAVNLFVWLGGLRHAGLVLMVTLAAMWMVEMRRSAVLAIALAVSCAFAVKYWTLDVQGAFTGAQEMAHYIKANKLDRYPIAAHKPPMCEPILPYLPGKRLYYLGMDQEGSYMLWDNTYTMAMFMPYAEAVIRARIHFGDQPYLLLLNAPMKNPEQFGYRLLYANLDKPFEKDDEVYWLYATPGVTQ